MPLPDTSLPFREWYDQLSKPEWTPAVSTIGTIWAVLYPLIAVVYGYALVQVAKGTWPRSLILPIVLNVVLNLCFTPIQFGLRNFLLASVVVVAVCATAMWTAFALYTHSKTLALALIPYIVWTGIASVLQITITWLNW
jgi:tryptophan-rich sensory protein